MSYWGLKLTLTQNCRIFAIYTLNTLLFDVYLTDIVYTHQKCGLQEANNMVQNQTPLKIHVYHLNDWTLLTNKYKDNIKILILYPKLIINQIF